MKKTVIALALATAGLSGVAQAAAPTWAEWSGPKTYRISGTITPPPTQNQWSWAVGADLTNLNGALSNNPGNKLKISLVEDTPILLGKTTSPLVIGTSADASGLRPQISFTDMDGKTVTLQPAPNSTATGRAYLELPVKNSSNEKIGTARLTVITAGMVITIETRKPKTGQNYQYSLYANRADDVFLGGTLQQADSIVQSAASADAIIKRFGGFTLSQMTDQIHTVIPDFTVREGNNERENLVGYLGYTYAFSYAMGMTTNSPIELTFTNKPTAITEWNAPLTIEVSYN